MAIDLPVAGDAGSIRKVSPLRILWLIDSLTVGGAETLTLSFVREARRRGTDIVVCARTSIEGNAMEEAIAATGVDVVNLGAKGLLDFRAFRQLLRLVRERRFDAIHAHLAYASIWGALASRLTGVPLIATIHVAPEETSELKEYVRRRLLYALLNRYARRVVAVSGALRRQLLEATSIRAAKFLVVHNGIDVPSMSGRLAVRDRIRGEFAIGTDELLFCTVAVLRDGKGIETLIRAIASQPIEARFLIVGDGPKREEWQRLAETAKVSDRIIWSGYRRDIGDLLLASDVFVLPTRADAFPTVLLEAMGAGLPVIASAVGGVPEIVDRKSGLMVPPGDAAALGRALDVATDARWRAVAGEAGRARVVEQFSTASWFDRLALVYQDAKESAS